MHQILVYADSLSWGIIPDTRSRFRFDQRWPGIVEIELQQAGISVRVIEDCLNGRRTLWEDPFKPGRNGLEAKNRNQLTPFLGGRFPGNE